MCPRPAIPLNLPSAVTNDPDVFFPVGRILCIGRNYAAHAAEMGDHSRQPPFHFVKSPWALRSDHGEITVAYPPKTQDLHHEAELVVALRHGGRDISPEDAHRHIWGYALGLDLTRRDVQAQAKQQGRPWAAGKDFDGAAVCGPVSRVEATGELTEGTLTLTLNGERRQTGELTDMIWNVREIIAYLSSLMTLQPGDLIYTGTPAGVGPMVPGDVATIGLTGLPAVTVRMTDPL